MTDSNNLQNFPDNWKKEFYLAKKLKLKIMEWTIDNKMFYENPINNFTGRKLIKRLSKKKNKFYLF